MANTEGKAWPEQRDIAEQIGCKTHSLKEWIDQLVSGGYLAVEKVGRNHNCLYTLLSGGVAQKGDTTTRLALPERATRRVADMGNANPVASPERATRRVAQKGDVINTKKQEATQLRSCVGRERLTPEQKRLIEEAAEILGLEWPKNGEFENKGWWINRVRENPGKARRSLEYLRQTIKETQVETRAGCLRDIWSRIAP